MAEILRGAPVAEAVDQRTADLVRQLKERGHSPGLGIIRLGEDPGQGAYERTAIKRCEKAGIAVKRFALPADCGQDQVLAAVDALNREAAIHGGLLFRPLPAGVDEAVVCRRLAPEKDVDGITPASLAAVFAGEGLGAPGGFPPCTAQACLEILHYYRIPVEGRRAVVVGRSLVVGRPLAMLLLARNATVTLCHTRTADLPARAREADLLFLCAGRAGLADISWLAPGQTVIDVGINVTPDGKITGDLQAGAGGDFLRAFTPVPGGVGVVTASVLALHVAAACAVSGIAGRESPSGVQTLRRLVRNFEFF